MKWKNLFEGEVVQFPKSQLATARGRERLGRSALDDMRAQEKAEHDLQSTLQKLEAEGARQMRGHFRPYIIDKLFLEDTPVTFGLYHIASDRDDELTDAEHEYVEKYIDAHLDDIIGAIETDLGYLRQIRRAVDSDDNIPAKKYLYKQIAEVETMFNDELKFFRSKVNLNESFLLAEFKASPTALKNLAAGIDARVGIEFEMFYPDAEVDDDEGEYEPDYDNDPRVYSIEDMISFYEDNDEIGFNDGRYLSRLQRQLEAEYMDFLFTRANEEFEASNAAEELVTALLEEEYPMENWIDEWLEENEVDGDEDEIREVAEEEYRGFIESEVEDEIRQQGDHYDSAKDEWINEWMSDTSLDSEDFLAEEYNISRMSDAESVFDLHWPIVRYERGSMPLDEVADDISDSLGVEVKVGGGTSNDWILTTDGSLTGESGYGGIELISSALTLPEMIDSLERVYRWARASDAKTNRQTGLHINVSVSGFDPSNLDYTKLALLTGDQYILNQYQRLGNIYAKSAVSNIMSKLETIGPENINNVLAQMKKGIDQFSTRIIHGTQTHKYTSIGIKDNRIEFRSPGGNWLDKDVSEIESTVVRFVVALDAAINPEKYRREYLKKLYKLMTDATTNQTEKDIITLFTEYASGKLNKADLLGFIRQARGRKKDGS